MLRKLRCGGPAPHAETAYGRRCARRNLRVTGVTDWTVSLVWSAPKGKAPASYVIQCSNGRTMTVPASQTGATFSSGFDYNRTSTFRVYAVDGATEAMVTFGNSMDNVTLQEHMRYYLYVNGVFDGATVDPYPHRFSIT